ncbi:MAG: aldo/keto reductase, partial [Oscillospiraceae bacterium]|nr:aldo/keto reductase [Oscillospiraceae bacterium]
MDHRGCEVRPHAFAQRERAHRLREKARDVQHLAEKVHALGVVGVGDLVDLLEQAPAYGDGYSERIVGRAIKGLPRDKFLISTKCTSIRLPSGGVA